MYVSIGGGFAVRDEDIVAVFDMDNATYSRITRDALSAAEKRGEARHDKDGARRDGAFHIMRTSGPYARHGFSGLLMLLLFLIILFIALISFIINF